MLKTNAQVCKIIVLYCIVLYCIRTATCITESNLFDTCSWWNMPFHMIMLRGWDISPRLKGKKGPHSHTSPIQGEKHLKYKYYHLNFAITRFKQN